jgi:hypothetical protein
MAVMVVSATEESDHENHVTLNDAAPTVGRAGDGPAWLFLTY